MGFFLAYEEVPFDVLMCIDPNIESPPQYDYYIKRMVNGEEKVMGLYCTDPEDEYPVALGLVNNSLWYYAY